MYAIGNEIIYALMYDELMNKPVLCEANFSLLYFVIVARVATFFSAE